MNSVKAKIVMLIFGWTLLLPIALLLAAESHVTPFRSNEFITNWLVCGPFPNEGGKTIDTDFLLEHNGEAAIDPEIGLSHHSEAAADGQVFWRIHQADATGKLDFIRCFSPNQRNVAYAAAVVHCEGPTYAILKIGSNDRIKIWLNGQQVHYFPLPRSSGPDADNIPVSLKKGKNILLAKVDQDGAGWFLYARMEALIQINEKMWVLHPVVSPTPRKSSGDKIADLFSILAFNMSDEVLGPISLQLKNKTAAKEGQTGYFIQPRQMAWLQEETETEMKNLKDVIDDELTIKEGSSQKAFRVSTKRSPLVNGDVFLVPGFHVDAVWVDSQAGFQAKSLNNLDQNLRGLEADSTYEIFLHEIPYLKPYYDAFPADRPLIRRLVREGRIATGGSYNQPNETTISGEALIRNILYGRLFHENVLGDKPIAYAPWDVFGHIVQMPQILAKSEFIGTAWTRSNYREPDILVPDVPDLYWGVAPDGSKLLTRKVNYGFDWRGSSYEMMQSARQKVADFLRKQQQQIPGIRSELVLDASDEKAPTAWMIGRTNEFKNFIPFVHFSANGQAEYFKSVLNQLKTQPLDIPELSRDESQYNEGCELSRFDLKMGNRLGENTLISAEKFATIAHLLGAAYPAASLDKAWRQILFGQHHDAVTGCGADVPYMDLVAGYQESLELSAGALQNAMHFIGSQVHTESPDRLTSLIVFNPLNWQRSDIVRTTLLFDQPVNGFELVDDQGRSIHSVAERLNRNEHGIHSAEVTFLAESVPSLGYKTFWIKPSASAPPLALAKNKAGTSIENERYRVTVDEKTGGGITSLKDILTGKEYLNLKSGHPGNELILLKEGSGFEPAWRFITTGVKYFSKDTEAQVEVFENALYQRIRVTGAMPRLKKRIQEITLYYGLDRIDFRTYLVDYQGLQGGNIIEKDQHDDRDFYCIGFPTDLEGNVPVLEDRFAVKSYFPGKEYLTYHSTSREWTSHHAMNSCYQWMDYSHSVAVHCGDAASIALGPVEILTPRHPQLRQTGFNLQKALAQKGITATPSYDTVQRQYDIQYRRFSFSIGLQGQNQYNQKLLQRLKSPDRRRLEQEIRSTGYGYALVHDADLPESWFKLPVLMIIGKDAIATGKAVQNLVDQLYQTGEIRLPAETYCSDEKSQVADHGLAIVNRGNIVGCVEPEGSMIMGLFHSVPWQGPLLNWTHDFPERKTHVFDYSLAPHQGDWRKADLVRRGYEFNNPILAITEKPHPGVLPSTKSFFSTNGADAVITAIKPKTAGNEAFLANQPTDAKNGIILRLYETHGRNGQVTVQTSLPLKSAVSVNLMERSPKPLTTIANCIDLPLSTNSIETMLLTMSRPVNIESTSQPVEGAPAFVRYWEHNEGAAPTGYLPVSLRLIGAADGSYNSAKLVRQIKVAVTNDYVDAAIQGTIKIETPMGIKPLPAVIDYAVPANSEKFYPVTLLTETAGQTPGFVRAVLQHDGQTLFDVLELAMPPKTFGHMENRGAKGNRLEWTVMQEKDRILIKIKNPFTQSITGQTTLISPCESWGLPAVNPICLAEFFPRVQPFSLPAGEELEQSFKLIRNGILEPEEVMTWAAAKLTYMGFVEYKEALGQLVITK